ncbi:MAG TPA: LpqB family beta-propeller domain-containing protein [Pyrinomonadaceae bacterium]|nr:LpqB family beta-propeller domain-containing protein [Pyrinomonadaceae bacterium]
MKKLLAGLFAFSLSLSTVPRTARAQSTTPNAPTAQTTQALPSFAEPSVSPDRSEIAFVSGGDVWTVPAAGGEARLLVSHTANEYRPLYSPDGRRLAFGSTRTGNGDLYVLDFDTGELRRLTFDDGVDQPDAWSPDGRFVYFSSTARDIAGFNDIYRVAAEGGTPAPVSADRYANEFHAAPSPDGAHLAFTGRGYGQWWRKGSSHIDQSEIWLMRNHSTAAYERLTEGGARESWPMWGEGGRTVFYVSDRGGAQNVWAKPLAGGAARQLTSFRDGRLLWPSISRDGRLIVFERDFRIWRLDTSGNRPEQVSVTLRGAAAGPGVERARYTDQIQELALSPDGKKIAFVVRGEVFAASATDGGDAARVTNSPAPESGVAWSPDSRRLVYVSDRDPSPHLFVYDFATNAETRLTNTEGADATPRYSPDGKWVAFERDGRELRVVNADTKQERLLASAALERPPLNSDRPYVFSPDGRWIAFTPVAEKLFRNVWLVPTEGGAARQISFLANVGGSNTVSWSPDGTFITFDTGQRTESGQLARVDLIPRTPRFREDQFRELFREETPRTIAPALRRQELQQPTPSPTPSATPETAQPTPTPDTTATPQPSPTPTPAQPAPQPSPAPTPTPGGERKPAEIVFEDIRTRLSLLPVGVDVRYHAVSPDGKQAMMIAGAENQLNIYVYPLDDLAREPLVARQLTATPGLKSFAQFTPDGREIFYLESGRVQVVPLDPRLPARALPVAAEMDVDFAREKMEVFQQGWTWMRDNFYDPQFHGLDWAAARERYRPHVAGARTPEEMRRVMSLMVGELNASHLGVVNPDSARQITTGRLGLRFDRAEYEASGRLRVIEVVPLGPAALARDAATGERAREIKVGDYVLAVDGRDLDARTNLDELLNYKINRRVVLAVASSADGAARREVAVRPVNLTTEKGLLYRKWVEERRAYVARASGGRLGYAHMFDMSSASLAQLYVDLDVENHAREGVVIDVRNNNGGFVNVYAIDVLARRSYLGMQPRGFGRAPARTVLGQRALELPTVLVTNQYSLSDAEDFTEGYRSLGLGRVVGEPTSGWIIYTSNVALLDGTIFRLPFVKITTAGGENMELNPRPVDVPVRRPVGESYTERDAQLDAAVRTLLGRAAAAEGK